MRLSRTCALLVAAGLGAGYVDTATRADAGRPFDALRREHDELHARLERGVGRDPIAARVFADPGQLVIAVRAGLVEDLTARVARQYLHQVTLDLADVEAHREGELRKKTPIGVRKVGNWDVEVVIHDLVGHLRAGPPRLTFARNVLDVELPVDVQPTSGKIGLRFNWDSSSVVNLVCKDFEVALDLEGRALRQKHMLRGRIELAANDEELTATPVVPEPDFMLKFELSPESWSKVEATLEGQDRTSRCGMFMEPENVMRDLRELVAQGIKIHLPSRIFRTVVLPARYLHTVKVNDSEIRLSLSGQRLRSSESMLWSSTRVGIAPAAGDGTRATTASAAATKAASPSP